MQNSAGQLPVLLIPQDDLELPRALCFEIVALVRRYDHERIGGSTGEKLEQPNRSLD